MVHRKRLLGLLMIAGLFFGCNSEKKLQRKYYEYMGSHLEQFAKDCADHFPVTPEYIQGKPDTIILQGEPIPGPAIDCPDGTKVKCPDCPSVKYFYTHRIDSVKVPNAARETQWRLYADDMAGKRNQAEFDRNNETKRADKWKSRAINAYGAIAILSILLIVYIILKVKKVISF